MRATLVGLLLVALPLSPLVAQAAGPDPQQVYKDAGAHAGKPTATVAYGTDPLQVGDLRVPPGRGPFPVAVLIHGGCWMSGMSDRTHFAAFAQALTKRGMATWNVEYRRIGDAGGGWPGTFQDVAAAVDKLTALAPKYYLDLQRVTFVGHSAGAHLALWAASRPRLDPPWRATAIRPVNVVAIDGPGALAPFVGIDQQVCGRPVIVPLMGGTPAEKPAEYRVASPADHLPLGVRQLAVQGELGPLMQPYLAAARASGDTVLTLAPPGANHFDIVTPATPNGAAVIDFIAANIAAPAR